MQKSGLKTGTHHAIFSVIAVKKSKILPKLNKRDYFCLNSLCRFYGVSRAKTDSRNKYMI